MPNDRRTPQSVAPEAAFSRRARATLSGTNLETPPPNLETCLTKLELVKE